MDAMTEGVFDAPTFYKLAEMFNSPFRDEANKLLGLALSDLRKNHNLLCDQCGDAGYAKARRDECAGLRYDLKQAFARYADGELDADEVQEIIARVAERSAEIEQDVSAPGDIPTTAPSPPSSPLFDDFHIPQASVALAPLPEPVAALEIEDEEEDVDNDENIWAELRDIWEEFWDRETVEGVIGFACISIVIALIIHFGDDPESRKSFIDWFHSPLSLVGGGFVIETVTGVVAGLALLWLLRKLLPLLGVTGLLLKLALFIDGAFVCYVVGFHETPWHVLGGAPFPALAQPVWPFVIVCVLVAGVLAIPEATEWFRAKSSRLRLVFLLAVALVVITGFAIRDRVSSPPAQNVVASPQPAQAAPVIVDPHWPKLSPSDYCSTSHPCPPKNK